ncbi:MAG: cupin domain-containing protein [Spirochaetota bacterium]|nr:cupin domain-containing protein [Spirochaetota bacterium]
MEKANKLGDKVRSVRELKNFGVDELAKESGISAELIASIEAGDLVPSLTPLIKLARTLGVRLGTFLDDQEITGPVVTRKGALRAARVVRVAEGRTQEKTELDFFSLAHDKSGRHMEPFMIEIDPASAEHIKLSSHEGEEFIHVLEGQVEIQYGRNAYLLDTGDSIYYDSVVNHHVHSADGKPARILAVVYAPF